MGKSQKLYQKAKKIIPGGTQLLSKRPEMFLPNLWPSYYAKAKGWGKGNYTSFKSENDAYLGLYQGKVDAIITTNTNLATKKQSKEFKDYVAGPFVPNYDDVVGIITKRSEVAFINYLNLFLVHQIRDGKLEAAYKKHFGTSAPESLIQSLRDNK